MMAHRMIKGLLQSAVEPRRDHEMKYPEILMTEVWQYGYNLVLMSASGDQRADSFAPSQVM